MSDRFDPEAWPYPEDDDPKTGKNQTASSTGQDDYPAAGFDKPNPPTGAADNTTFGDPYSNAPYSDTGFDDYGYGNDLTPGRPASSNYGATPSPGYDAPSSGYGNPPTDDWGSPGGTGYDFPPAATPGNKGDGGFGDNEDYGTIPGAVPGNDPYGNPAATPYGLPDSNYRYDDTDYANPSGNHRPGSYDDDPYNAPLGDDYDDQGSDYDDDYDREPSGDGHGLKRKILGIVVILLFIIAAALLAMKLFGGNEPVASSADDSEQSDGTDENTGDGSTETPSPSDSTNPSTTPTTPTTPPTAAAGNQTATVTTAPTEVTAALNDALGGWGRFAVTGDLATVQPYFAAQGEQYKRFQAESEALRASPPGGAPLTMTIANSQTAKVDDNNWIVRGKVTVSRSGESNQEYNYEFRLVKTDGKWLVATIRTF